MVSFLSSIISQSLQPPRSAETARPVSAPSVDRPGPEPDLTEFNERMLKDESVSARATVHKEQNDGLAAETASETRQEPLPDARAADRHLHDDQPVAPIDSVLSECAVDEASQVQPAVPVSQVRSSGDDADAAVSALSPLAEVSDPSGEPMRVERAEEDALPREVQAQHQAQETDRIASTDESIAGNRESTLTRMAEAAGRQLQSGLESTTGIDESTAENRSAQPELPQVPEPIRQIAETIAAFQAETAIDESTSSSPVAVAISDESQADIRQPAVDLSPRRNLPPPVADSLRPAREQEVPQVRIGQINVLIDEQGSKPKKASAPGPAARPSPFGLRGL